MAPSVRKTGAQAVQADVALLQSLKNCLVNLPASLVSLLDTSNTVAQNVVVELSFRQPVPGNAKPVPRSVFLGWTGMSSTRKPAPVVGRDGLSGGRGSAVSREQETIEIDATFAGLVGLAAGQKVGVLLRLDPPHAHTIAIEPLTPSDWEIIELHAQFLELNFLSQIRALPNPSYTPADGRRHPPHPLTLHLSPTSTANVAVTSLTPAPGAAFAFAKIAPDAEVHVAPKYRQQSDNTSGPDSKGVADAGRRSTGARSGASTVRRRSGRGESSTSDPVFLRGVDRGTGGDWFDGDGGMDDTGLRIWVDRDLLLTKPLRGVTWASVSVIRPAGLLEPVDPQKEADAEKPATRVVARLGAWDEAPDGQHAALSSTLSATLASAGMIGGLIRVEAAPAPMPKQLSGESATETAAAIKSLHVIPFLDSDSRNKSGLRFGGDTKRGKEEAVQVFTRMYGKGAAGGSLLEGPLTHGMMLAPRNDAPAGWMGAIIRFDPPPRPPQDVHKPTASWILGNERTFDIRVQEPVPKTSSLTKAWSPGEPLPARIPSMVGIDPLIAQMMDHVSHSCAVLLTGGLGAGKTSLACLLAHRLRRELLFHTTYLSCRSLTGDEMRLSAMKKTLDRLFGSAAWGARLGGRSVVVLDDIDQLCPVETELQVGGDNGRSRQISEIVCSLVRQYCAMGSGVVVFATAQSKEAVNNVVIGGHVVREIISLKAPNKDGRRRILDALVHPGNHADDPTPRRRGATARATTQGERWHDHSSSDSRPSSSGHPEQPDRLVVDDDVDFLDLAGQTDGYMPGDLDQLVSRARNEALIRSVPGTAPSGPATISLTRRDFAAALDGFTPASLRNVTLQSSTTRWASIGGLHATRQTLLETLQYPTTYAPIFAQCPLRLRSGLLLYGYPGCGKTLLASAVAGECGLNFISVKGPEILNKYIGASEKSVRDLFERAEAARPCVLFFDEFDSIAPKRGHDSTGVTDRVVNQMLTQMDGAEGLTGVYVLAATSRPDLIDPALLRPGRLDKSLMCDMPGLDERIDILAAVTRTLRFDPGVLTTHASAPNLRAIAQRTEGYTGADLQAVVYNAQLDAIHDALGEHDPTVAVEGGRTTRDVSSGPPGRGAADFMHFRYGEREDQEHPTPTSSAALVERATIAAKIAALHAARRQQRQAEHARRRDPHAPTDAGDTPGGDAASTEPVISWRHVEASLTNTRASISPDERHRLGSIYREFVVGRNGELPNGQGGTEIGGRTSLM